MSQLLNCLQLCLVDQMAECEPSHMIFTDKCTTKGGMGTPFWRIFSRVSGINKNWLNKNWLGRLSKVTYWWWTVNQEKFERPVAVCELHCWKNPILHFFTEIGLDSLTDRERQPKTFAHVLRTCLISLRALIVHNFVQFWKI